MKKTVLIFCATVFAAVVAQATTYFGPTKLSKETLDQITIHGPADLQQVKTKTLSVMGPLNFKDLQVTENTDVVGPVADSQNGKFGQLKVTGPVDFKQIETASLQVIGPVKVDHLAVNGETVIIGPLTAQNSKFQNLTITADKVNLTDVEVNNIFVKSPEDKKQPVITLSGKTSVNGSIQFESKNGLVVTQGGNTKITGQVMGGEVSKK